MSTYLRQTKHPISKKWEDALWIDDHFGPHNYGVQFPSNPGEFFDARNYTLTTRDNPCKSKLPVTGFITKDSGKRMSFDSGMVRDTNEGKPRYELVYRPMLKRWAELMARGAAKYGPGNWMKANGQEELDRFKESAFRHFMSWIDGETDEDHGAAIFFNVSGAEYVLSKINK